MTLGKIPFRPDPDVERSGAVAALGGVLCDVARDSLCPLLFGSLEDLDVDLLAPTGYPAGMPTDTLLAANSAACANT